MTIPIIALTAYAMAEDRAKCISVGCTGYLTKPVDEDTLLETANQHLTNGKSPVTQPKVPETLIAVAPSAPPSAPPAAAAGRITSSLADNPRMKKIIPEFVDGLAGEVSKMMDLIQRNDLAQLKPVVHQLLGACGGYGFEAVSEPAAKAEQSIKAGKALEAVAADIKELVDVIRRIEGYDKAKEASPVAK